MKKSSISIPFAQEIMNSHLRNCRNGPDPLHFWDVSSLGCSGFNDGAVGALLIFLLHVLPFSSGPKVISKNAYQMEFTSLDADYLPVIKHGNGKPSFIDDCSIHRGFSIAMFVYRKVIHLYPMYSICKCF